MKKLIIILLLFSGCKYSTVIYQCDCKENLNNKYIPNYIPDYGFDTIYMYIDSVIKIKPLIIPE